MALNKKANSDKAVEKVGKGEKSLEESPDKWIAFGRLPNKA